MSRFHKLFTIKILSSAVVHGKKATSVGTLTCQMLCMENLPLPIKASKLTGFDCLHSVKLLL